MGQYEIMQIVKAAKGKKMSITDIKDEYAKTFYSEIRTNSISVCLVKLRKFNMIKYTAENGKYGNNIYRYWL